MEKILLQIPCKTVDAIMESVFDNNQRFGNAIDVILDATFDPVNGGLFCNGKDDALTDAIYKKDSEGKIIFPVQIPNTDVQAFRGSLGDQTSGYHKETIEQHVMAATAMYENALLEEYGAVSLADYLTALLHDAGKKYTLGTNKRGEVCFYGHEMISAYFAANIFWQYGFSKEEAYPYIFIIYNHMLPFTWNQKLTYDGKIGSELKEAFQKQHGKGITRRIELLNQSDIGFQSEEEITKHEAVIEKGRLISRELLKP